MKTICCTLHSLHSPHPHVEFSSFFQTAFHGSIPSSVPNNVPHSTVSGINISQQLQDIYIKTNQFHFHIEKVQNYHNSVWNKSLVHMKHVKERLSHLSNFIVLILKDDLNVTVPTPPPPPTLSHTHDYEKKVYEWAVIHNMTEFLEQVLQVLQKLKKNCECK